MAGSNTEQLFEDIAAVQAILLSLQSEWGLHTQVSADVVHEMCRYGGAELHNIAAIVGGTCTFPWGNPLPPDTPCAMC